MYDKTTNKLLGILKEANCLEKLESYVNMNLDKNLTFETYMNNMFIIKSLDKSEVISASGLSRTYGYQLLQGARNPGRDKIICLCLGAKFDFLETQKALTVAKEGVLYSRNRRDAIIIFAIENNYSVIDTNELLLEMEEPWLE